MRYLLPLPVLLAACMPMAEPAPTPTPMPGPAVELPFFGDGYRMSGDQCRRVGESAFTNDFLDDAADLVGCPADMENLGVFVTDTNAILVAQVGDVNLYSVPVR